MIYHLRHYWQTQQKICACGCTVRRYIFGRWHCYEKIREELHNANITIKKHY